MKAFVCHRFFEDLSGVFPGDRPKPEPGPAEVLVRVRACGLNYRDMMLCQGRYQLKPALPFVPGMDLAGEVAGVGEGVTAFSEGDAVAGTVRPGALAEFAAVPSDALL